MRSTVFFLVILSIVSVVPCASKGHKPVLAWFNRNDFMFPRPPARDIEPQWYDQELDHFDPLNNSTFKQLYYYNDEYYKEGGPLFFYFNGEGPLSSAAVQDGFMLDLAKEHNALVVSHEHRYYGQTHPTSDLTTKNMKYLSVEQALADAAVFQIDFMKMKGMVPGVTPALIVGGSYSGALSAFYRLKFPDLVNAAYSSSGVVEAIEDFDMYFVTVRNDTKPYKDCEDYVLQATSQAAAMLKDPIQRMTLFDLFGVCNTTSDADFWYTISGSLEGSAQYGGIASACETITTSEPGKPLDGYANFFKGNALKYGGGDVGDCMSTDWQADIKNALSWDAGLAGYRSWYFQKCTQFGFFKNPTKSGFFSPLADLQYHLDACKRIFGDDLEPNIEWILNSFGGNKIRATKTVFVNGSVDPWHNCGVLKSLGDTAVALFMNGTSHCRDLHAASPDDPAGLVEARQHVSSLLKEWLA